MSSPSPAEAGAQRAVGRLTEMCADLRTCAIVGSGGEVLAQSEGSTLDWGGGVTALWSATDASGEGPAIQLHLATEAGELFLARSGEVTAAAVTDRFALGSLMFCDLRAVLRGLDPDVAATSGAPS